MLSAICEFVTAAARDAGLCEHAVYDVQIAVDEACSNIIEHAYGGEGRGSIECTCRVNHRGLTIVLLDQGRPFDPQRATDPDLCCSLQDRTEGGLGLYFIRRLMDQVHFEFSPGSGNVLTMSKLRKAAP
jgi:serine/threonine-protein kinase RsbW